ncbi:unnamed protein product [Urochloa humidicola]
MDHYNNEVPRDIPFHFLEEITDGFSDERKLGAGAFGEVYMGVYKDGEKIAVKILHDTPRNHDEEQFLNEFNNLASLQHPNIVRLIGYCHETQKKYVNYNGGQIFAERIRRALCLEYMQYGSLEKRISDEHHGLDWNTRYAIIMGICKGLKYLHEELKHPIYHLDLKPENILLDENMVPKIADFGLARFFREEKTQTTGNTIGTLGYLPPEYIHGGTISNKFDIFSLGVIVIKITAGHKGYTKCAEMSPHQFIELVHENWRNRLQALPGMSTELLEPSLAQVKMCIEVALRCVESERHQRPSIGWVVEKLDKIEALIQRPSQFSHMLGVNDRSADEHADGDGPTEVADAKGGLGGMEPPLLPETPWIPPTAPSKIFSNIDEGRGGGQGRRRSSDPPLHSQLRPVQSMVDSWRKGKSEVIETNHILILGWSDKLGSLLKQLAIANKSFGRSVVVVLAERDKEEMEMDIANLEFDFMGTSVICRSGSPLILADLKKVSVSKARAIIVLASDENADQSDARALRVVLSLTGVKEGLRGHVVVEISDLDNGPLVKLVGGELIETVVAHDVIGRLMIQCALQPGLAQIWEDILGFENAEFRIKRWPELDGMRFGDVLISFPDAVPCGVKVASKAGKILRILMMNMF